MKKISEMSLEELQDYALKLEEQQTADADKITELTNKNTELVGFNQSLQRRNNDLLMKVEQQHNEPEPAAPGQITIESCEDFARRIAKGE